LAKLILNGATSGSISLESPAVSGTTTLTLPANTGTVVVTSGAQTIEFADGSASTPSITNSGDTNTGMFFPAADTVAFAQGGAESMRLNSSGNVLIGLSSSNFGTAPKIETQVADGRAIGISNSGTGTATAGIFLNNNGSSVGSITYTTTATAYNTSSDYRLKENIAPMTGALATVQALKPVTYKWKYNGSNGQGFIAHELAEVVPDCVTGKKDAIDTEGNPEYQGVDTSFLVATLTAAIQEQQTIIETLKSDIAELKAKVNV
jgi:hypothetical protein